MTEDAGGVANAVGIHGNAASFVGTSTKSLSTATSFVLTPPYSIAFWVYISDEFLGGRRDAFLKHDTGGDAQIAVSEGTGISPGVYGAAVSFDGGDDLLNAGVVFHSWNLIVFTQADGGGQGTLYINGTEGDSAAQTSSGSGVITLGNAGIFGAVSGLIDEVMIWNVALTSGNVTTLWNGSSGTFFTP